MHLTPPGCYRGGVDQLKAGLTSPAPWGTVEEQGPQNLRIFGADRLPEELQRQDNAGGLRWNPPASGRACALPSSRLAWWPQNTLGRLGGPTHRHPPRVRRYALCPGALLAPLRLASSSLEAYLHELRKPELPTGFSDEAGRLMADVQQAVDHLDTTIRSLEGLSGTDHLTGLPNRRAGEVRLAEDHAKAKRGGAILTVAVVDVNNFKAINDTHGHLAGDVCIRHVARVMRRNVREGDWLARWGGDEFVLSLWDASVFASPEAVLGRINADLRRSPVRLPGGEELVPSISVGAHRYAGEDDIRELLAKADAAMYEAKREGRAWVLGD